MSGARKYTTTKKTKPAHKHQTYLRFTAGQRIEHIVLILSFSLLALTGLPQKYPLAAISQGIVAMLGGIEMVRIIHRVSAVIFLVQSIYHLVMIGYKLYVQRLGATMIPTIQDGKDAIQSFGYNLGLFKSPPKLPRYNFTEKAEYWAMAWGLILMAVTGFMLWNPIATTNILPGEFIPAAKVAHGGEAVLAVLAIILWHFYHVHIRRFNKSMWTGHLDREEMEEEHGAELEQIEAGLLPVPPPPDVVRRRTMFFAPVAGVLSLLLLYGVYQFVTLEQTAITTLPPQERGQVFVPFTPTPFPTLPPTPTAAPTRPPLDPNSPAASLAWNTGIQTAFRQRCADCHGQAGGNLGDFNAETYQNVMTRVQPGDPDNSPVLRALGEGHPGFFLPDQLAQVRDWITYGASEVPGQPGVVVPTQGPSGNPLTWSGGIEAVFVAKCGACHGTSGGFTARTYDGVLDGVQPGNPAASRVITAMEGGHPGTFSQDELDLVTQWIEIGAPQH
jgi:cytochrome b subunit of formate dehydrogenase/mono/diheme cytochrome c family protein